MDDPVAGKIGVRKAIAYLLDREALVDEVYEGTADPLYSIIPAGISRPQHRLLRHLRRPPLQGQGRRPPSQADGITGKVEADPLVDPVPLRPRHRRGVQGASPTSSTPAACSTPTSSPCPSTQYEKDIEAGKYGVYVKGWVPDYPDADNFTAPFFGKGNVLGNNYSNDAITDTLIPRHGRPERPLRDRRGLRRAPGHRRQGGPRPPGLAGQAVRRRPRERLRPGELPRRLDRLPLLGDQQGLSPAAYTNEGAPSVPEGAPSPRTAVRRPHAVTARRDAPARSRTRTPRPAPGHAAPASSGRARHAS